MRSDSVVIVHDYITQRGGAERVVLCLKKAFDNSLVVTSLFNTDGTFPEFGDFEIRTSILQRVPLLKEHHRLGLLLYPIVFSRIHVDAPVTICSTSGWSHGVSTSGKKILYVYNCARWLYQTDSYLGNRRFAKLGMRLVGARLRAWDRKAAQDADRILSISHVVQDRLRYNWGLNSEVVHPPHAANPFGPMKTPGISPIEPGYLLLVARMLPYKGIDAVVRAMELLPDHRLVLVGQGPERKSLLAKAGENVAALPSVSESELRWLYKNCFAVVSAAVEDFGLVPLEAMAYGRPAIVLRAAGFLETVLEDGTGLFFDRANPDEIARAIRLASVTSWNEQDIRAHASQFSETEFVRAMHEIVAGLTDVSRT